MRTEAGIHFKRGGTGEPTLLLLHGLGTGEVWRGLEEQLAERWPEIVEAGAKAFSNIDHMVVLNGADGMSDMFAKALSLGGTGLGLARQLMDAMGGLTSSSVEAMANQNSDLSTRD